MNPITALITIAPRIASGRFSKIGISKADVSAIKTAMSSSATCVLAPARSLAAD